MLPLINVEVGKAKPGETAPRRYYKAKDGAVDRPVDSKATNIFDFFEECVERQPNNRAIGWRNLVDLHDETKMVKKMVDGKMSEVPKTWTYFEYSKYQFLTYKQLKQRMILYGKGLSKIGLTTEDRLHIFAATSAKWMQTFLASQSQSIAVVTLYDTLGESGLTHSMVETGSNCVFVDNNLLSKLINPLQKATSIRIIIHGDAISEADKRYDGKLFREAQEALEKIKELRPEIKSYSMDEVIELGEKVDLEIDIVKPKPSDLSCIMYTSGSTGTPKGVVLNHDNILAGIGGVSLIVGHEVVTNRDRIIAFLPLAHIFELVFELISFWWGGCLGYANVRTLTDASVRNCQGDMVEFQPTIMVGVAAVWESVKKGIMSKVEKLPPLTQKLFWSSFKAKQTMKAYHLPGTSILDALIFKKVKQATGGHLRVVLNGGSPLSGDTQIFISTLIAPMLIGYGLTETVANTTVLPLEHFEYDVAGALAGAITVKLIDVEEAGYFAKNNQGEILIRGKPVTPEYYKNPEETSKLFNEEGWFCTGDIGEWTPKGYLKVIDRKKNLVKTLNGEYIALEKLESVYRSNKYVANVCCYADTSRVKPVGIIVPNEIPIKELAVELKLAKSVDEVHMDSIVRDEKLNQTVLKSLLATAKAQGLAGIELIAGIVLLDEEWTPQNGYVTSAQKLQRRKILDSCKDRVEEIYLRT